MNKLNGDNMIIKEIKTKSILTKSNLPISDFSVNPYIGCPHACKYCYASFMKRFTNHKEPWGEFLDVKIWDAIKNPKNYDNKELFIGSATDPYNPYEEKYKRTRNLLLELSNSNAKISIQTKSNLVLRDLDLIKKFKNIRIGLSINTLDELFRLDMDNASTIEQRIETLKTLHENKIITTCFISPIFPGITNVEEIIDKVKDYCNYIWLENLNLRGDYKSRILDYIKEKYNNLFPLYDEIYNKKNNEYWFNLDNNLKEYTKKINLEYVTDDDTMIKNYNDSPVVVNYFYHEKIKKSAKK